MQLRNTEPVSVVCLILQDQEGQVFIGKRPAHKRLGDLWEFPGGKVEPNEANELALRREIQEELGIEIGELEPLPPVDHVYPFGPICLFPFIACCSQRPALQLTEHSEAQWITLRDWQSLEWVPADVPVIRALLERGT